MNFFKTLLVLITIALVQDSYAFNWKRCKRSGLDTRGGVATKIVFGLLNTFSSTAQYITSTGDCAMIGRLDHDKKVFVADNMDKMKDEFARGSGEYSKSFAKMHGCYKPGQDQFLKLMKGNYLILSEIESTDDFERLYQYLEASFKIDPVLVSLCRAKA
jgi:hypothetical protein